MFCGIFGTYVRKNFNAEQDVQQGIRKEETKNYK